MGDNGALLIDMDGTLYHGSAPLKGAKQLLALLTERHDPYLLITNNARSAPTTIAQGLERMGIPVEPQRIVTSGEVTLRELAAQGVHTLYIIGSRYLRALARDMGFQLVEAHPDCVVVSQDDQLTYDKLELAARFILEGSLFVCTELDHAIPQSGTLRPHTGATVAFLETVTSRCATNYGKPERGFIDCAMTKLHCRADALCIVGDNLHTDIEMGRRHSLTTCLLLTGITTEPMLIASSVKPTYIFKDLMALIDALPGLMDRVHAI